MVIMTSKRTLLTVAIETHCLVQDKQRGMSWTPTKVRARRDRMSEYFSTLREPPVRDSNESSSGSSSLQCSPSGRHVNIATVNLLYENSNIALFRKDQKHDDHITYASRSNLQPVPPDQKWMEKGNIDVSYEENKDFSDFLYSLWKDRRMCDIVIKVNGKELQAHKVALAAYSDKFTTRYCEQAPQSFSEIILSNTSAEAVQILLDYIYTTELKVNVNNLEPVLLCAKQLGITSAVRICETQISNFDKDNVLVLFPIAESQGLVETATKMHNFVCENFYEISKTTSFLHACAERVRWVISKDELCVRSELDIFLAVLSWIEYNRLERLCYVIDLMECVRFVFISPDDLVSHVEPVKHIFEISECKAKLYNAFRYHALRYSNSSLISAYTEVPQRKYDLSQPQSSAAAYTNSAALYTTSTTPYTNSAALYTTTTAPYTNSAAPYTTHEEHNTQSGPYTTHIQEDKECKKCGYSEKSVLHGKEQYSKNPKSTNQYTPNYKPKGRSTRVETASPAPNISLVDPPPLPIPPKPPRLVVLGGINPFAADVDHSCRVVEEYNPSNNSWKALTSLPVPRHHLGAAMLDGYLFVVGGSIVSAENPSELSNPTNICFRYDPSTNCWSRIASLNTARMYHATAVLEGVLYAICGQHHMGKALNTVEYYNPDTDTWDMISPTSEEKIGVAAAGHNSLVYTVGGFMDTPSQKIVLDCVDYYNPISNSWTRLNPVPTPCCHSNLVEVSGCLYLIGGSTVDSSGTSVISLPNVLRYNDRNDTWEPFSNLNIERHDAGATVIGSRIYIVGGICSSINDTLADMECLDVETGAWLERLDPMTHPAMGVACCTLPGEGS